MTDTTDTTDSIDNENTGLMDRFDELFDDDGEERTPTDASVAEADQDVVADDPELDAADEVADDDKAPSSADKEKSDSESSDADSKASDDEEDEFDKETKAKIADMANDPHPGIKYAELRKELKERDRQLEELKTSALDSEEVQAFKIRADKAETLEQEVEELKGRLGLVDYQSTEDYQREIVSPLEDLQSLASSIETSNSLSEGSVFSAIGSADQAAQTNSIESLIDNNDLSRRDITRLYTMADQFLHVAAKREALQQDAADRMAKHQEMQVAETTVAQERENAAMRRSVENAFSRFEGKLPGFVTDDGKPTESWNELRTSSSEISLDTPDDRAHAIFSAQVLPHALETMKELQNDLKAANILNARLSKAKPSPGIDNSTPTSPKKDGGTFLERLSAQDFGE